MKNEGIKPNYAEIARRLDCDYRTAKKYFDNDQKTFENKKPRPSLTIISSRYAKTIKRL